MHHLTYALNSFCYFTFYSFNAERSFRIIQHMRKFVLIEQVHFSAAQRVYNTQDRPQTDCMVRNAIMMGHVPSIKQWPAVHQKEANLNIQEANFSFPFDGGRKIKETIGQDTSWDIKDFKTARRICQPPGSCLSRLQ